MSQYIILGAMQCIGILLLFSNGLLGIGENGSLALHGAILCIAPFLLPGIHAIRRRMPWGVIALSSNAISLLIVFCIAVTKHQTSSPYIQFPFLTITEILLFAIGPFIIIYDCICNKSVSSQMSSYLGRKATRRESVSGITSNIICIGEVFMLSVSTNGHSDLIEVIVACIALFLNAMTQASTYVFSYTVSNHWLFRRIITLDKSRCCKNLTEEITFPETANGVFLRMLLDPQSIITRIRERIEPAHGSFLLNVDYEAHAQLTSEEENLVLPVTVQSRTELTNELSFSSIEGYPIRRLTDAECKDVLSKSIQDVLSSNGCQECEKLADALAKRIIYASISDSELNLLCKNLNNRCEKIIKELRRQYTHVKPLCLKIKHKTNGIYEVKSTRYVPLVPVRNGSGPLRFLQRLLSKRRLKYYYGLGNADRAKSYHLTFTGPSDTYLVDSLLGFSNRNCHYAKAEIIKIDNRYDQRFSRLYIRKGRGFSHTSLALNYESRNHKSLQMLCMQVLVSTILIAYLGLKYVIPGSVEANDILLADIVLPISIIAFAGIVSIWEALEKNRAEEWVWILSTIVLVLSLAVPTIIAMEIYSRNKEAYSASPCIHFLWISAMTILIMASSLCLICLYIKTKQHGAHVDKIPYTRSLDDSSAERLSAEFLYNEKSTESDWGKSKSKVSRFRSQKRKTYDRNRKRYEGMIGEDWDDGWLVPTWASLEDPFNSSEVQFSSITENHISS